MLDLKRDHQKREDRATPRTRAPITEQSGKVFRREMAEERDCLPISDKMSTDLDDSRLVFLQYAGRTPSFAGCAKCGIKFFTPHELLERPRAATDYIRKKFDQHTCTWGTVPRMRELRIVTSSLGICLSCHTRFLAPVSLHGHAEEAELDIRRKFRRHRCRLSDAA